MKKIDCWNGKYRGIPYTVKNWKTEGIGDCWAYYLYINTKQLDENIWLEEKKLSIGNHYHHEYENTIIGNLDWHMGCTFYKKHGGYVSGESKVVEVGCDYQHYWDEGHSYDERTVEQDAKDCIDSLYELTKVKSWCVYCGEYFYPEKDEERCPECVNK